MTQSVKNPPAIQETQVQSLGQEDPLEKEMATHSSILAWRAPWTEKPGGLQSTGSQESDMTKPQTTTGIFKDLFLFSIYMSVSLVDSFSLFNYYSLILVQHL